MAFEDIEGDGLRYLIDATQIYEALLDVRKTQRNKFAGSMRFATKNETDYLFRKVGTVEKSLGRRSSETELIYESFLVGRAKNAELITGLVADLRGRQHLNRAFNLGRVPNMAAAILRRLDDTGSLGTALHVVGTNAIYAYEAKAGVRIASSLMATLDVDLLFDTRRKMTFLADDQPAKTLIGLLKKADATFQIRNTQPYRAINAQGFLVDLIRPMPKDVIADRTSGFIGESSEDLEAVEIDGLQWLVNAPKFEAIAIAENGLPVRIAKVDPRYFGAHKLWLSNREDRDPQKKRRDREQGEIVLRLAVERLNLPLDDVLLDALPGALRGEALTFLNRQEAGPSTPGFGDFGL